MTILSWMTYAITVGRRVLRATSFASTALVVVACATLPPTGPAVGVDGPEAPAPPDPEPTPPPTAGTPDTVPARDLLAALQDLCAQPTFTPYDVAPEVRNVEEVRQALNREYPPVLRDAGIEGTVITWICITDTGDVANVLVNRPSGVPQLDEAGLRAARVFEFTPAINQGRNVAVWVSIPMTFQANP